MGIKGRSLAGLVAAVGVMYLIGGAAAAPVCVDYGVDQEYSAAGELMEGPEFEYPYFFAVDAHGRYMTVERAGDFVTCSVSFYDLASATPLEPLGSVGCGNMGTTIGDCDGSLASYRSATLACAHCVPEYRNMVVDLSSPELPTGRLGHFGMTWIRGRLAFVYNSGGLYVYDLADVVNPELRSSIDVPAGVADVVAVNGVVVIVGSDNLLQVFAMDDPGAPASIGSLAAPSSLLRVAAGPDYLVLCCGEEGLRTVDMRIPASPVMDDTPVILPGPANNGEISHPMGYFLCTGYGVVAVDLGTTPPTVRPGRVVSRGWELELGNGGLYLAGPRNRSYTGPLSIIPVECNDSMVTRKIRFGDLRAMYR